MAVAAAEAGAGEEAAGLTFVIARSTCDEAIQSWYQVLDCFAEPVIGRRFAPTRWLAMTVWRR
ncbi:MAG: hypothetical protein QOJ84_1144 [Bradyrhizobium sp.]|jgi:hypothetical protein|nr:hypothetical protein [Bradyrhizobium sp.]